MGHITSTSSLEQDHPSWPHDNSKPTLHIYRSPGAQSRHSWGELKGRDTSEPPHSRIGPEPAKFTKTWERDRPADCEVGRCSMNHTHESFHHLERRLCERQLALVSGQRARTMTSWERYPQQSKKRKIWLPKACLPTPTNDKIRWNANLRKAQAKQSVPPHMRPRTRGPSGPFTIQTRSC